jgi:carbonic anhydrase/acetyltransferase-like protein (isoleucine patch superfamily)
MVRSTAAIRGAVSVTRLVSVAPKCFMQGAPVGAVRLSPAQV